MSASPTCAPRFLGDLTHDAAFLALPGATSIDGIDASARFDGTYTDLTPVPQPAHVALLPAGLGLPGVGVRRRGGAHAWRIDSTGCGPVFL